MRVADVFFATAVVALGAGSTSAATFYLGLDVPSRLGALDYTPNQVIRSDEAGYALALSLPVDVAVSALHRRSNGTWLFSPAHPVTLQGKVYVPRDIAAYDGASYSLFFDGRALGVPDGAAIDALLLDSDGNPVLSFDVPVMLAGRGYRPSDLVLWRNKAFSLFWNSTSAGVPLSSNVVGADRDAAGVLVLAFDVPTRLGGSDFVPGQRVQWNGGTGFSVFAREPGWPPATQGTDFALISSSSMGAGAVPDGRIVPGQELWLRWAGDAITLSWGASCVSSDVDYVIYEGSLSAMYSHQPRLCSTGGATAATVTPSAGQRYFLVGSRNDLREGSLGNRSNGQFRPPSAAPCLPRQVQSCP